MKALFSGLILALVVQTTFAQKAPAKFGNISLDDLKSTSYAGDSSATAYYLFDYGKSYVTFNAAGPVMQFERHFRIKVLKTDGLDMANIVVPLGKSGTNEEKVISLKAATYNLENGAMVESKMSKDGIFKEKLNKYRILQKFTLPNVKVGSIIEVSYTLSSDFFTNFPDWQFQYDIPVSHSEYWALIPDIFVFEKYMQGYLMATDYTVKPQNTADFQVYAHHWTMKDVPAFKEEPFMTSEDDYISKVNFALSSVSVPGRPVINFMGSWEQINVNLVDDEDFGKVITGSGFLKKKVEELTAGLTDPQQKLVAIYNYVKENLEWNGVKDFWAGNLKEVHELKKGTSGDINLTLAAMLEKADIPVKMVLLSTRDHGFVRRPYPMYNQFNYVIVQATLGDKTFLLDATDRYLPMHILPERCLNGEGLIVSKTSANWIRLESKTKAKTVVNADLAMSASGELKGKLSVSYEGYDAGEMRAEYVKKGEKDFVKDFLGDKTWEVEKSEFQNVKDIDLPAKQSHDLTIAEHATVAGDVFYVSPFVTLQERENIFTRETREYPVDFGTLMEKTYLAKIVLPEGYGVDELPKSKVMMLPGNAARYTYNVTLTGNTITAVSMLQINKSLFVQTEYPDLREFYNQLVAKQAEQFVVRKK